MKPYLDVAVLEDSQAFRVLEQEWEVLYYECALSTRFSRGLGSTRGGKPLERVMSCGSSRCGTEPFW
jgi:hypothetical protein